MPPWVVFLAMLQPARPADIRVDVALVNVTFTVRDQNGALQPALKQDDFTVFEDGVQQRIQSFSREFDLPLTLGMVLDLSGSQAGLGAGNVALATEFLRKVLQPGDFAFVAAFGGPVKLIQDYSTSIEDLQKALMHARHLYWHAPRLSPRRGASPVRDAMYFCAREKLKAIAGRKALIVITDGEDYMSSTSIGNTIEMLQSADTILYAFNPGVSPFGHAVKVLVPRTLFVRNHDARIATETGGQEFKVSETNLKEAFQRIEEELRTMYVISYVSTNTKKDGTWRKIEIRTARPDLVVSARRGYRAPKQ
jgi:VWFA-related protein